MKHLRILVFSFFFSSIWGGCSSPPDKFGNLDLIKWRSDRGGCNDVRKGLENDLKQIQDKLLGKHIEEVGRMFGRPDINQLAGRDQKFYVYFLEKGPHCNDIAQKSNAQKLILRFNSVGLLSEITFQARPL
ncbi:hypothetical protein P1X15_27635 [Runella sp. MFBS21]|uniref:hypothetical protein n=1 Tax=Runella sp. MFBS21 TaxID=3034018 RepID=UPI0023F63F9F|nr:hypothetical protein [Runella sp. MFBS21]MDF7821424.1 hypothetical protein [Runella sp. MFBS21]